MVAGVEVAYSYLSASSCAVDGSNTTVALATSGGPGANPRFFDGLVAHPRQTARAILLVGRIARSRFYEPPNMVAARLASIDPIVTAEPHRLRFESFSACCGVYSRLDLLEGSLADAVSATGTTNVDLNPSMRHALGGISDRTAMRLEVGLDEMALDAPGVRVVEKKVPLPERWIRGLAQVQIDLSGMTVRHELGSVEARRFLQSLPTRRTGREQLWVVPNGPTVRLASRATDAGVALAGPGRLRDAVELLPFVKGLRVYGPAFRARGAARHPEPSAWELLLADARFWLVLSPTVDRGFSGEGGVLASLAAGAPDAEAAATGEVGFDLADGAWFSRPLPFDGIDLERAHPRLREALALVESGAVTVEPGGRRGAVESNGAIHTVHALEDPPRCTCPWYGKHAGTRGPCKHVLAVLIASGDAQADAGRWLEAT